MFSTGENIKRTLLVILGTLAVILGVVGIVLPVLPTTPFLLLAAHCFMRESKRFYNLLVSNRYLGSYIRNYMEGRGMSVKWKVWVIFWLWFVIGISFIFAADNPVIRIVLAVVAVGVTIHILCLRTYRSDVAVNPRTIKE